MSLGTIRAVSGGWFKIDEHSMVLCVFVLSHLAWVHMYLLSFCPNKLTYAAYAFALL